MWKKGEVKREGVERKRGKKRGVIGEKNEEEREGEGRNVKEEEKGGES